MRTLHWKLLLARLGLLPVNESLNRRCGFRLHPQIFGALRRRVSGTKCQKPVASHPVNWAPLPTISAYAPGFFYCFLMFHWNVENYTSVLKKKGNPDRKTFAMWKIARIGRETPPEKAWKQEIRREHNSNPLQRHEHVQLVLMGVSIHWTGLLDWNWNDLWPWLPH